MLTVSSECLQTLSTIIVGALCALNTNLTYNIFGNLIGILSTKIRLVNNNKSKLKVSSSLQWNIANKVL